MKRFVILVVIFALQTCRGDVPLFFRQNEFNSALFAEAVNHFVSIGEPAAVKELNALALDERDDITNLVNGFSVDVRIGLICRVLPARKK